MVARISKTKPPASYPSRAERLHGPREEFEMTRDEFMAMGGNDMPEDYEPGAMAYEEVVDKPNKWSIPLTRTIETRKFKHALPAEGNFLPVILAIAHRLGVHPLTINWPDPFLPDITAVRLMEVAA